MKINIKKTFKMVFYILTTIALLFSIGCPGASGGGTTTTDDSASDVKIIPSAVFSTGDLAGVINRSVSRNRAGGGFLTVDTVGKLLMPLFTGIKLNTENLETIEESDGSFTIKKHFGNYMNRSVLVNVKPSSAGTVIKYYQDVDNDTIKDSTDIEIGTATVTYAQADTPSHGSWEFSQLLNNPFGGESFQLDASGDYGPTGFLGSGKFVIATTDYSGNFDVTWTEVGGYKTIRVRNGSIMPKATLTVNYFQVPSLDITIEINSTTNASEVTEKTTTEEIDSEGNKVKLERDITTNNDQNGIVTSGNYIIYKTVYNSAGDVTTARYLLTEGEIDPNATTTTNPNATTTTITGTTNPGDTTTTTETTEPTTTTTIAGDPFNAIQWTGETPLSFTYDFDGGVHYVVYTYVSANVTNAKVKKINNTTNQWEDVGGTIFNATINIETISLDVFSGVPYVAFTATPAGTQYGYIRKWDGTAWVEIPAIAASGKTDFIDPNGNISYNSTNKVSIAAYGTDKVAVAYCADIYYVYVNFWDGTTWTTSYMNYWYQKDPQLTYVKSGMINYFYIVTHTDPAANTSSKYVIALVLQGGTTSWDKVSGNSAYSVDSSPVANCPSNMAIDSNGLYYSAYTDDETSYNIIVKKCIGDGTQWTQVPSGATTGKLGLSPSILLDGTTPYVSYRGSDAYNFVSVIKYDSSIPMWNQIGTLFPASETTNTKIVQDTTYIYVAYVDDMNKFKISRIAK